jgi:hypothetical protein
MKKQMELFEPVTRGFADGGFEDGGLLDEGGSVDPISGNDVPIGSTKEEVRDDIPAQLSEGEFVFPADVVRYFGLERLMEMRQEAKKGLKLMEEMGQMGNSDEATIPDDIPFDVNDLELEDDGTPEYAQGGVVNAQVGAFMQPQPTGMLGTQQSQFANYGQQVGTPPVQQPIMPTAPYQPPMQQATPIVSTTSFLGGTSGGTGLDSGLADMGPPDEYRTYRNDAGDEIQVPFKNGKVHSTFTIPQGFKPASETTAAQTDATTDTAIPDTKVMQSDGDDDAPAIDPITSGDKGQFTTTDMRGVGYDRSQIKDEDLLAELKEIGKSQISQLSTATPSGMMAKVGSTVKNAGLKNIGSTLKSGGVDSRKEFLTAQKVTMDAFLGGLNSTYGGARDAYTKGEGLAGMRLHELSPTVQKNLAGELKATREAVAAAVAGKTAEDLGRELADSSKGLGKDIKDLGLSRTFSDTVRGREIEREKSYGQLFAEARATKSARDKLAAQYGLDAKGKSLSTIRAEANAAQDRINAEAEANRKAALARQQAQMGHTRSVGGGDDDSQDFGGRPSYGGSVGYGGGVGTGGGVGESFGAYGGFNKGGLANQMKQSGLASKK